MPRPISWLPRLAEIRHAVRHSVRSHYGRRDLERLFELQPRAAQKLLESLPTVQVGTSRLAERDPLLALLDAVCKADHPASVLADARTRAAGSPRRSLRQLIAQDRSPSTWDSLPDSLRLEAGRVSISFARVEELAAALTALASLLDADLETFVARYEVRESQPASREWEDLLSMFEELKGLEAKKQNKTPSSRNSKEVSG